MLAQMPCLRFRFLVLLFLALLGPAAHLIAHPLPDIPVRAAFEADGQCKIQVEVDPRLFEADPNTAPSMLNKELGQKTEAEREALRARTSAYAQRAVAFYFEPLGRMVPDMPFDFTAQGGHPLANPD